MTETTLHADEVCFPDLIRRLRARARRLARTPEEAEDMAQDTVLKLWQQLNCAENDIRTPERYAMIMLHNLARHRWRSARPTEELEDDMATTEPVAPARLACHDLLAAIERLPTDQRALMTCVIEGETSPHALAAKLGVPCGTVMSRLSRARAKLRREMGMEASVMELL